MVGIVVCEDGWNDEHFFTHRNYQLDPVERVVGAGAHLVVNLSASPWSKGKVAEVPMTRQEIVELLRPEVGRTRWVFPMHLWFYLVFLAAVLWVDVANLVGYRTNPVLLAVQTAVTVLTMGFLVYTGFVLREARGLERLDDDLASIVQRRLRFFERQYGVWLWLAAVSVSLPSWAVSTLVDNAGGQFRINHPVTFVATVLGQILIVYGALRVAHQPSWPRRAPSSTTPGRRRAGGLRHGADDDAGVAGTQDLAYQDFTPG